MTGVWADFNAIFEKSWNFKETLQELKENLRSFPNDLQTTWEVVWHRSVAVTIGESWKNLGIISNKFWNYFIFRRSTLTGFFVLESEVPRFFFSS